VCPFQPTSEVNGTSPNFLTVGVMHSKMNKVLKVDRKNSRLTVGAGMKVSELLEAATANNMSVVSGTLPAYAGLTLGGVLASGAHGSGDNASSNIVSAETRAAASVREGCVVDMHLGSCPCPSQPVQELAIHGAACYAGR
jgi:FAD/FMN-containing dehydrogenase